MKAPALRKPPLERRERYLRTFVRDAHHWLALGYGAINISGLHEADEDVITGELVRAMNDVVERPDAPGWMSHLVVQENVEQNTGARLGKRRKRIDIELMRTGRGARPRFGIEAKRLYRSDSVSEYLGDDGLGCFLAGQYAVHAAGAGMLGYVQQHEPAYWAQRISAALDTQGSQYGLREDGRWRPVQLVSLLPDTYESQHARASADAPITILHTFLRFSGGAGSGEQG